MTRNPRIPHRVRWPCARHKASRNLSHRFPYSHSSRTSTNVKVQKYTCLLVANNLWHDRSHAACDRLKIRCEIMEELCNVDKVIATSAGPRCARLRPPSPEIPTQSSFCSCGFSANSSHRPTARFFLHHLHRRCDRSIRL